MIDKVAAGKKVTCLMSVRLACLPYLYNYMIRIGAWPPVLP